MRRPQDKIVYFSNSTQLRTVDLKALLIGQSVAMSASGSERGTNHCPLSVRSRTISNLPQGELTISLILHSGKFYSREKTLKSKANQTNNGSDGTTKDNGFLRE